MPVPDEKTGPGGAAGLPEPRLIALKDLMGSDRELLLSHNDQVYRLRLTKANKLILTK